MCPLEDPLPGVLEASGLGSALTLGQVRYDRQLARSHDIDGEAAVQVLAAVSGAVEVDDGDQDYGCDDGAACRWEQTVVSSRPSLDPFPLSSTTSSHILVA